ncbi:CpaF family protein [Aureibacillus halotolerans]|uniref:Pilus assembly protein CpaF n=1 Tax=Aureibacillus halotolerans TaxID=1508390 RepID=A0A4R6UGC3_9BACI|nr:CpaF family protein [Aureibacillus halotolerans]TDQ42194.1 pilus assembly protein CpaF [Aureibacillus halotolerans]
MKDISLVKQMKDEVMEDLDLTGSTSDEELEAKIEEIIFAYSRDQRFTATQKQQLVDAVFSSFRGLDALQPLLDDPSVTEIMINSHNEVFIERAGQTIQTDVQFPSRARLEDIIQSIVSRVNRIVNESSPIVDARLQDGSRVNVVLPPIALKGPTMTIRKFPEKPVGVEDLIKWRALSAPVASFLEDLVKAKYNVFISGGTGSGKTTFLNVLSNFIPQDERIITIEDSAELQIRNVPNLVALETRNANTEGKGEVTIRDLIRASLRMRPNRIIVGEVRGSEALDMLQAMNTGHDGSLSTGHANSTKDMLSRLETMVLSGASLPVEVIRQQISSAVNIMIHLSRLRDKTRKVVAVSEMLDVVDGEYQMNPLFEFVEERETDDGKIIGDLQPTGNQLQQTLRLKAAGIPVPDVTKLTS